MTKDVMVGYPCYDHKAEVLPLQTLFHCSISPNNPVKVIQYMNGDSLVSRARNKIAEKFLKSTCKYLLFVDNDIYFTPDDIAKLRSYEKGLVGGVYFKKKLPFAPVANSFLGTCPDTGLSYMNEIGTGFMMISRDVFEKIIEMRGEELYYKPAGDEEEGTYYDFFRVGVNENRQYLSEDYFFCQMVREAGFKVHLDIGMVVYHKGGILYPIPDDLLLDTSADFLERYNTDVELDREKFDRIQNALNMQKEVRKWT